MTAHKIRIVKRYKNNSPHHGIEEADIVEIEGGADGAARFVTAVNLNDKNDFEIIDWDIPLITKLEGPEILTNPTGGGTGKLILPNS